MGSIIARYKGEILQGKDDAYLTLLRSITGQQISVKAADSIWARLEAACGGKVNLTRMKKLNADTLRSLGYSHQKCAYLADITQFFSTHKHLERDWAEMTDEEVIRDLIQIKGIGRWTAEMFLIFNLLRPDVLPVGDLGVVKGFQKLYGHQWKTDGNLKLWQKRLTKHAARWAPYRTVAVWYLWRSLDPVEVGY